MRDKATTERMFEELPRTLGLHPLNLKRGAGESAT